jgi:hypothetical protein
MMRGILVVGVIVGISGPVQAQVKPFSLSEDSTAIHVALVAGMGAQGADLSTTMYCLGRRNCVEANPLFAPFAQKPLLAGAWKMGVAAGSAWALLKIHEKHPKLAFWISVAQAAGYSWVAMRNARIAQEP